MSKFGYGIVRDKHGKPRIDHDPKLLHPQQVALLTEAEREELGLWPGVLIIDAGGTKRGELVEGKGKKVQVRAIDDLRAASQFFVGKKVYRLKTRADFPAGTVVNLETE